MISFLLFIFISSLLRAWAYTNLVRFGISVQLIKVIAIYMLVIKAIIAVEGRLIFGFWIESFDEFVIDLVKDWSDYFLPLLLTKLIDQSTEYKYIAFLSTFLILLIKNTIEITG